MPERIVILGSGESGTGAAILAKIKGLDVFVSDKGEIKSNYKEELNRYDIPFESGKHTEELILNAALVVKSPGIPDKAPLIKKLHESNIPVISEIEWAYRYMNPEAKIIAITGSNGKTTTTSLIYHILNNAGLNVGLGGNIGHSFARMVALDPKEIYVLEISSFQLDGCTTFRPNISVLTNITEDHLDRYDYQFENYIRSKFSISRSQTASDYFVYCADDPVTVQYLEWANSAATKIPFSFHQILEEGAFVKDQQLHFNILKTNFTMPIDDLSLHGTHNTYNSMASGIAARLMNVRKEVIRESLQAFESLEHRLEFVATIRGIDFVNDSKATNVNSAWFALESMNKQVVWIAGGVDKGNDYSVLKDLVKQKVKAIICLGKDNEPLHQAFSEDVGFIVDADSAEKAVQLAYNMAESGDVVLLAPACASFDLFENYEDRGRQFKRAVRNL